MIVLTEYRKHVEERAAEGIVPKPERGPSCRTGRTSETATCWRRDLLLDLLTNRCPAGVDEAAYVKAAFLTDVAKGNTACALFHVLRQRLLSHARWPNIPPLVNCLTMQKSEKHPQKRSKPLLMFDAFHDVEEGASRQSTGSRSHGILGERKMVFE